MGFRHPSFDRIRRGRRRAPFDAQQSAPRPRRLPHTTHGLLANRLLPRAWSSAARGRTVILPSPASRDCYRPQACAPRLPESAPHSPFRPSILTLQRSYVPVVASCASPYPRWIHIQFRRIQIFLLFYFYSFNIVFKDKPLAVLTS